ncbi:MAG: tRNA (adenosine(37)-N6)-threonylcarbamoyltransferase complex ATPase subunit type 1 TsaE [Proteobacteria bacterium]|nr:tRNA (adenosine(37)-N6)-threonylcarbamoyltransferase complex ATPase subunit type 1 TsaE [Pseudomonadota bacterium]
MIAAWTASLPNAAATTWLGEQVAERCREGDVIALCGPLGAGKTTWTQGFARGLGVSTPVRSPTFALCHEYAGRLAVLHIDVYRLGGADEAEDLGFFDRVGSDGVSVIEWADRFPSLIPGHALWLRLDHDGDRRRVTAWEPDEPIGAAQIDLDWTEANEPAPWTAPVAAPGI